MKRKCTAIAAALLLSLTACGTDPAAETAESAQTAGSTETTALTTEITTTEQTTTTESQTEPAAETTETQVRESKAEPGPMMQALTERMKTWDAGDLHIRMGIEQAGMRELVEVYAYQGKVCSSMQLLTFTMEVRSDGTDTYMLDRSDKTCCRTKNKENSGVMSMDDTYEQLAFGEYVGSGEADFHGEAHAYEDYQPEQSDSGLRTVRCFYDASGDLIGCVGMKDDREIEMDYQVHFLETTDDSRYQLPEGYTEIDEDEMNEKMMNNMLTALQAAMGSEDTETNE